MTCAEIEEWEQCTSASAPHMFQITDLLKHTMAPILLEPVAFPPMKMSMA